MNSAANSSESLVKPTVPPNRDQELTSSNSNPPNEPTITSPSRVEATKASPSGAMSDDHYLDIATTQKKTSFKEQAHSQPSVSTSEKAHMPTRANIAATRDKNKEQDKDKIKHSDKDKEKEKDVDMDMDMDIDKKRIKDTIKNNETLLPSLPDNAFVHPIHALNSTSPIVRLKPSHKRSQSAQLPLTSPWSILQSSVPATRSHPSSSLSQMTLSTSHTNSLVSSESSSSMEPSILLNNSNSNSKNDDTRGQSSIWYSPFQSGLDISIESDQEQGKHGSRSFSKPGIQTDLARNQKKLSLGPILPPSSFFESSPRTPRIMPFNQHLSNRTLGVDDWSARTRSSSIAAPMTPLLESECQAPADYFGGSHSVSSSRRGSTENNLTESLLSGRARMFAASDSTIVYPRQTSLHPSNSPQGTNGSDTSFSSPLYSSSSLAPPASALFTSASSPLLGHTTQEPLALTTSMLQDPTVETIPTFVNPWESSYPIRSNHTVSEKFLPFGSSSSLNVTDNSFDRDQDQDRQSSLLRLMNGDSRVGEIDQMDGGSGKQERDDEAEAIRRGFLFPSLAHYTHASMHSVDLPSFRPFPSVEMSLAAAANQPPPLTEDLKYDFVDLSMQDFVRGQTPVPEISQGSTWTEGSEKKPRERHRHGRNRSGHHKSASLSSFFPPMPPVPGVLSSTSPGIQADTVGSLDPLNQLANNQSGESHHHGSQGHVHGRSHSKQGRTQGSTSGRDGEGAPSTSGRRRAGTVQDGHHRSASKHHHHQHVDFSKSKRTPKKEQSV
ncbi:hypothetical protein BC939DRAFT_475731 [Gamsiella multidivaricata]|uniref:uncharacterized protein n=1 Tax=Gamsiella multidivaricata TaxID=101098 RepID=UPI00221F440A|nr:uncharacterized protein BC939DRAFT_475731 [Gamsiella multidivaricata]KAI7826530.1 hypothetical protein BC939DRAFT_475731 [Gamsiella multidivaricata]